MASIELLKALHALTGVGVDKSEETPDAIVPTSSPVDLIAGAAGARLGSSLAQGAGSIVGNEIGSVGANIKPQPQTMWQLAKETAQKARAEDFAQRLAEQTKDAKFQAIRKYLGR